MTSSHHICHGRKGFSLVELMVVLAILALLVAALMPAMQSARTTALSAKCMSNLRQIGLAIDMYAGDHDSRFPATERWAGIWMIRLRHYMGYIDRTSVPVITGRAGHAHSIDRLVPTFACPQTRDWPAPSYYNGTYGINLLAVSPEQSSGRLIDNLPYGRTRESLRNAPSRIYLVSDNYQYSTEGWNQISNSVTPGYIRPRHHQWRVNILFMDSHVQQLARGGSRVLYYRDKPDRQPDGWW